MASRNLHKSIRKCLQKSQEMLPEDMADASLIKIAQGIWGFMHLYCMSQSVPGGPLCDESVSDSWCDVAEGAGENMNASQFYFTLDSDLDSLDEKHTIFGEVTTALIRPPASADASVNHLFF